ncbi:MAG: hypothetical protein HY815_23180, partial [Candidatus Riflebacteria bacterium]|nr:hypothetical protein [Candidatus Riflebacteria bacterium]
RSAPWFLRLFHRLLTEDRFLTRAFRLVEIAVSLRSGQDALLGRPASRARPGQPVDFLLMLEGQPKARHSMRRVTCLEWGDAGYVPETLEAGSRIRISGTPAQVARHLGVLRRSLLHELAHYVHNLVQDWGIPYSGRDPHHSVYEIRTAPFAFVEGEPQAFLAFLETIEPAGPDALDERLLRRTSARRAWVRRLVSPNQFLRAELACGQVMAALLNSKALREHYVQSSFYRLVASAYPALGSGTISARRVRMAISPAENAFIKFQFIKVKYNPANTLDFLRGYLREFPGQRRRALRAIAVASDGLLLDQHASRSALRELSARVRLSLRKDAESLTNLRDLRRERRARWMGLIAAGADLVDDAVTPLWVAAANGEIDVNRVGAAELVSGLDLEPEEAAKIVTNRRALRSGEYLDLLDVARPRPRALKHGSSWTPLEERTYFRILGAVRLRGPSRSPLRSAYLGEGGTLQPRLSHRLSGM